MSNDSKKEERRPTEKIAFKYIVETDTLLQEVFDPLDRSFKLLVYDRTTGGWSLLEKYEEAGIVYVPLRIPINKKGMPRVILPWKPSGYTSVAELINEVGTYLCKYAEVKEIWFLSRFVLHTWIYDVGDYAIQIQVLGDWRSGKTRLLKLLRLLCYNALFLSGGTSLSAYRRLQNKFQGALIVNEFELDYSSEDSNEFIIWLNSGFEKDLQLALSNKVDPSKQEYFDPFGPKAFASRNIIENIATRSRLVIIRMEPKTRKDIPIDLPPEAYEEAAVLRNKLLMFRLEHWQENFRLPNALRERLQNDETIDDRFKQNALPLLTLASITGEPQEVDEVFNFYRAASLDFRKQIATSTIEGILFNVILEITKEQHDKRDFYGAVDEDFKLIGITSKLLQGRTGFSARTIARALTRIGMVQETPKKKVLVDVDEFGGKDVREKTIRRWVFPTEKSWKEAYERYYYREDKKEAVPISVASVASVAEDQEIPDVLKSVAFIPLGISTGTTLATLATDVGTDTPSASEPEEKQEPEPLDPALWMRKLRLTLSPEESEVLKKRIARLHEEEMKK
jgi:hypothetical protein